MEILAAEQLNFRYPGEDNQALDDITFAIEDGAFVTLCGLSGCGKSTLLRQFKNVIRPAGISSGKLMFSNREIETYDEREQTEAIGFVSQSADNQIVTDKVWHELAFGLESLGMDTATIRQRVSEMAMFFGIQDWFYKNVSELSGGQKQILCLASVMTMLPKVILLDEPTSQLDPIAALEFIHMLQKINQELGVTVVIAEQRLEEIIPVSDQVIVMDAGRIVTQGSPEEVCETLRVMKHPMINSLPIPMKVAMKVERNNEAAVQVVSQTSVQTKVQNLDQTAAYDMTNTPLTVNEGRIWLRNYVSEHGIFDRNSTGRDKGNPDTGNQSDKSKALTVKDVWFRYDKEDKDILKGVNLQAQAGELLCILGGNGTGKSTLLSIICGLKKATRGRITVHHGKVGMLPQNPMSLFLKKTVLDDLRDVCSQEEKLNNVIEICRLKPFLQRHPYDLSGGEQQRAALAKVILLDPEILLLDEPTKGFDNQYKNIFGQILKDLTSQNKCVLLVSHDVEFCAEYADRCALFFDGNIVSTNTPNLFFSGNSFYTTAANRMSRGIIEDLITADDIVRACGGATKAITEAEDARLERDTHDEKDAQNQKDAQDSKDNQHNKDMQCNQSKKKPLNKYLISAIIILLLIPVTLFIGVVYLDDRKYLFISLLVLLECMVPFFLLFEGRSPQARELVMISVLCAICVAGRAVFYMLPEFKPLVALIVIIGAAVGAETGFLVGAVTMLVSNMIFGQGPWTPWQMFAMGMIGFLSGLLFHKKSYATNRILLSIYGFIAAFFLYGGVMNPAAAIMAHASLNRATLLAYYASGMPIDLVRGIATVIFTFLLAKPVISKIDRVRIKYDFV